jgi:acetylornithine deacetylase
MGRSTVEILEALVSFDTSSRNSNLPLIEWVASFLGEQGVEATVLPDETGTKANLVARIGPAADGGVVLCGHTDVVPVDGQPWTRDPFTLTSEDGRLYGRGTTDMKGFIASALAAVPRFVAAAGTRPVVLAFSYDEEVGCFGAPALASHLTTSGTRPAAVITGEPTGMRVARAHKGIRAFRTTITGRDGHSSRPDQAASAVVAACRLVVFVDELAGRLAADGLRVPGFAPEHTTMNVGVVSGGTALNIVPRTCSVVWEYRWVPGEDVEAVRDAVERFAHERLLPDLRRVAPEAEVTTEVLADVPALDPRENEGAAELARVLGAEADGEPVAFGTDGAVLQAAGLPTVVCGPGFMDQGHRPDEFVEVAQLERCDALMERLASWASGAG